MYNAMQYIKNLPTLWPKDKGRIFPAHLIQLENHQGMR